MASPHITIEDSVTFDGTGDVFVSRRVLDLSPEKVVELLSLAFNHCGDQLLVDACCGGIGPLSKYSQLTFSEYLELKVLFEKEIEVEAATKTAKQYHSQVRRKSFDSNRSQLFLQLIDSGVSYICAHPDCGETKNLTIDHVVPLSRGGSDELNNLQFLCLHHNSSKGDKVVT